jgi:long-chain fatty acid transport protein
MRRFKLSLLATSLSALVVSSTSFAGAFQFYELGTPIIGTAGVGQAAVANDASTSYFNPAGMAQLPSSEYMLGSQLILPYNSFSKSSRTTFTGDNGGNAGGLVPGMTLYYVYNYSPKVKLGVSLNSPYAGGLNYDNGWAGRYFVQNITFYTVNLNPSISYLVNPWLSVGAGVDIEYANLSEEIALPIPDQPDGQADIKTDNFASGGNIGVMLTPYKTTKIGATFRSRITHNLRGNTTFARIPDSPSTSVGMVMPQNIIISIDQAVTNKFSLLGEVGWAAWSSMKDTVLHVDNYSLSVPRKWNDTYRLGLAGQYHYTQNLLLQLGGSFDSSPTNASHRLPDLPMDRQIRLGAGLMYAMTKAVQLGFSYEYINFGHANINQNTPIGALVGSYERNYGNVAQFSINVAV